MNRKVKGSLIKWLVAISFVATLIVNWLGSNALINKVSTADISDRYPTLFTPAGITFAVWGVIYGLLLFYVLYQFGLFKNSRKLPSVVIDRIGIGFIISSVLNIAWIFAWHYQQMLLSVILIIALLAVLIVINNILYKKLDTLTRGERLVVRLPFSVYIGWITVAVIANIAIALSLNWDRFGIPIQFWAIFTLLAGMSIASAYSIFRRDFAYCLVVIWAYIGILIKHLSNFGFSGQYPSIIATVVSCLVFLCMTGIYVICSQAGILPSRANKRK